MNAALSSITTCFFTGHRELPTFLLPLKKKLNQTVLRLYQEGIRTFVCGGALGFDTLAAETVLKLKKEYLDARLCLMLPCREQTKGWSDANIKRYRDILDAADAVEWVSEVYTRGCMHKRNRAMADISSVCVAYLKKESGGTAYTVAYAENKGLKIIHLA